MNISSNFNKNSLSDVVWFKSRLESIKEMVLNQEREPVLIH